jgi:very-short-patch-repair endonuclease
MEPVELVTRLGGVATTAQLRFCGERAITRALKEGTIIRVTRGHYSLPGPLQAHAAATRVGGVVSHLSAAQHWGWKVKLPPDRPVVTVPRNRNLSPEQRRGVDVRWATLHPDDIRDGVTSKVRTVVDCARTEPYDAGLAVADSAVRDGDLTPAQVLAEARSSPRTGRSSAVRVARAVDGRAANPFESVLRAVTHSVPGLEVESQQWVSSVGRVDLLARRQSLVIEAESWEFHGDRDAFVRDVHRYTAMVRLGYAVVRFTWEEVMFRQDYVREVLTAMVALGPPWMARAA